jgi:hypothetical protein
MILIDGANYSRLKDPLCLRHPGTLRLLLLMIATPHQRPATYKEIQQLDENARAD